MPKIKTRKGVRKRFKLTGGGKLMSRRAGKSHLMSSKTRKRKRKLRAFKVHRGETAAKLKRLIQ